MHNAPAYRTHSSLVLHVDVGEERCVEDTRLHLEVAVLNQTA